MGHPWLALATVGYTLKLLETILVTTGAGAAQAVPPHLADRPGLTRDSTRWLIGQGIKTVV